MMNIVNTLGSLLNHQEWIHSLDNPYHYIGGAALEMSVLYFMHLCMMEDMLELLAISFICGD